MNRKTRTMATVLAVALSGSGLMAGTGSAADTPRARPKPGHVAGPRAGSPVEIARDHIRQHAVRYGVTAADVSDLAVAGTHRSEHTGVTHVYLEQRVHGLRVAGSSVSVNVASDGSIVHVGSRLVPNLSQASGRPVLGAGEATAAAARRLGLTPTSPLRVLQARGGRARATLLSDGGISLSDIPARLVYQALRDGSIRLAWNVEIEEVSQEHWWNASVDAETGTLLDTTDYVDHEPADGSAYRVFALPLESPNDGDRTLVEAPADASASPFGWHDTNGEDGAELTTTQGNNAHAYIDTANAGVAGAVLPFADADGGSGLDFDFPWDPDLPPTANKDSAVTNLFYWNNIIHDVFY
ncbi:MAG: M36 family metallopeptidase, partial [Actinomycetota bacterium]